MVDVRDAGALLQRAGFALPVIDTDRITVTYPDAFALMRDLKAMGESNALVDRPRAFAAETSSFMPQPSTRTARRPREEDPRHLRHHLPDSLGPPPPSSSPSHPAPATSASPRSSRITDRHAPAGGVDKVAAEDRWPQIMDSPNCTMSIHHDLYMLLYCMGKSMFSRSTQGSMNPKGMPE